MREYSITISTKSIVKLILTLAVLWFAYMISDILFMLFFALVFAAIIDPAADWCERYRIPRSVAVLGVFVLLIGMLVLIGILIVPAIASQARDLVTNISSQWDSVAGNIDALRHIGGEGGMGTAIQSSIDSVRGSLQDSFGTIFTTITGFFGGIFTFLFVMVLSFYMVVERDDMRRALRTVVPDQYQPFVNRILTKVRVMLALWVRGQLALCVVIGVLTYIGLSIIGVPYAGVLALIAGLLELVPYIGPVIAAIPAVFFAFTVSPLIALITLGFCWVVQILENNLIVPKIMQKAVGLNPLISIVAILIGAKLAGVIGALLAVPVATAILIISKEIVSNDAGGEGEEDLVPAQTFKIDRA
ncbi:MAG: AI-2E family transporter [Patescibacteria group bacterium]